MEVLAGKIFATIGILCFAMMAWAGFLKDHKANRPEEDKDDE